MMIPGPSRAERLARERAERRARMIGVGQAAAPVAGAAAGTGAGAALGSVVPVIGTATGAAVGGSLGGAGGSLVSLLLGEMAARQTRPYEEKDMDRLEKIRAIQQHLEPYANG